MVALAFDFINGFHDAANSIATVVSTRVLSPMQAVVWAAFFNFVAAFGFGVSVAKTIGKGIVDPAVVDHWVILGGLVGAIVWNLITWYYGIPLELLARADRRLRRRGRRQGGLRRADRSPGWTKIADLHRARAADRA